MSSSGNGGTPAPDPEPPALLRRDRLNLNRNAALLAIFVAVLGVVGAAFLTPLGEKWIDDLFEEKDPTCPGEACDGKNPQIQGCGDDARMFRPTVNNPALLQIRYSKECNAVWAKIERGRIGDSVTVKVPGVGERTAYIEYDDDKFTNMVKVPDGEFRVEGCTIPKPGGTSTHEAYCIHATEATAWR